MVEPIDSGTLGGLAGLVQSGLRSIRSGAEKSMPLRMKVDLHESDHPALAEHGLELAVSNGGPDARFRAQVVDAAGIYDPVRTPPWHAQWQHDPGVLDHEILRGGRGLIYVLITRGRDSEDTVPRFLEFPNEHTMYRTWVAGLPEGPVEERPEADFIDKRVRLRIRIWNRRVKKSRLFDLTFWVNPDLTLGATLERAKRRWFRKPAPLSEPDDD